MATPVDLYNGLSQDQRSSIAQQFINMFRQKGDKHFDNVDANNASAQQLAEMHQHAEQNHPGLLQDLRKHPMVAAALGAVAAYELDKHFNK